MTLIATILFLATLARVGYMAFTTSAQKNWQQPNLASAVFAPTLMLGFAAFFVYTGQQTGFAPLVENTKPVLETYALFNALDWVLFLLFGGVALAAAGAVIGTYAGQVYALIFSRSENLAN